MYKTVYFPDYPLGPHTGLTVPFTREPELFKVVAPLSSFTIRQIIGTSKYADLCTAAAQASLPISTFVRTLLSERLAKRPMAHGLQATFKGGRGSPMHEWFPYLEGYSPDFVRSILDQYAPQAEIVLDPFCGSGTTALVAAALGKRAYFCEVNPVCRAIIDAKVSAQSASPKDRAAAANVLRTLAEELDEELGRAIPDIALEQGFGHVFGARPFFSPSNFADVLRLRTLLDRLQAEAPFASQFATVAGLRSLVPASYLVRRGDLRFRNAKELAGQPPAFRDEVRASLHLIASDLTDIETHAGTVEMLCENARDIVGGPAFKPQAIVTSPPYLNGTNYFRNTKIELWFMRALLGKGGLRVFRDAAITSGINDVTNKKTTVGLALDASPRLEGVLQDLIDDAYDQRIPMMVASYFNEMAVVATCFRAISDSDTKIAMDLGDSCYGSVWVPTDLVIRDIMAHVGFDLEDEVVLRERQSRDGRKLTQTLQIFKTRHAVARGLPGKGKPCDWTTFRNTFPHQKGDYAKRNWGHPWHSMCSFQGKLKPSIAHHLVRALLPAGKRRLLDPFSGVGTIPFEARLEGHTAFGFDISPAAVAISRAKLSPCSPGEVATEMGLLSDWIDCHADRHIDMAELEGIRFNGPIASYFHPRTFSEIIAARQYFRKFPPETGSRALVMAALLHILHGNRPYALSRRSHPITPFAPTGEAEYRAVIPRLAVKVHRLMEAVPEATIPFGACYQQDATAPWPEEIDDLDAIVTSPPFFDSTRFYAANWMRLWFAGWNGVDFKTEPAQFVDERQKVSLEVYDGIFRQSASRLKRGGIMALHLGKSAKCDMAQGLIDIAGRHLKLVDILDESVAHCESHGIRDKGTVTHHQYVVFRRD